MYARPYDLYLKYLVTRGIQELPDVNRCLDELGLCKINDDQLNRICDFIETTLPKPVQRQAETQQNIDQAFCQWMKQLGLQNLWDYKLGRRKDLQLIFDVHNDPKLRLSLNCLLIKGGKPKDIANDLNIKFSYMLQEVHVAVYREVFWNPTLMTRAAWRDYLETCGNDEKATLFVALTEPMDVLKTHLEMPARPRLSDAMQQLFVTSFQKAKFYLKLNGPDANKEARNWINVTMQLADKYEKHSSGDEADFGKALQMEFEFIETDFQTPDEAVLKEVRDRDKASQFDA